MGAAVQHVEHGHRQRVGVGTPDGAVERDLQVVRHRLGTGQRDGQQRVGAEPALVRRAVEVDHGVVDGSLIERVEPADDVGDLPVDVGHGAQHALARKTIAAVAQLDRLADAGGGAGGCDGAATRTGVEQHLGFDGRVAAGVENLAPDHVLNGAHDISPWVSPLAGHRDTTLAVAHLVFGDALGLEDVGAQRQCTVAQRLFGVDAEPLGQVGHGEEDLAHGRLRDRRPRPPAGRRPVDRSPRPRRASAASAAERLAAARRTSGSRPTARALRASLVASISAGSPAGMPSVTLLRPFSLFLIASQLVTTCSASSASTSPNTWGWRWTSLSCTRARHVGQVEPTLLVRQAGMEDDLEEQIAQLLFEVRERVGVSASAGLGPTNLRQRVEHLVALLDQVRHERCVGLRPVPGAALAQRVHEGDQPGHLVAGGAAPGRHGGRDVQRGEVVGLHRAVELPPVDRHHHLVVEAEMVQQHRPRQLHAVIVGDGQLHLGEQVPRPALGHQERAALVRRHAARSAPASTRRTPSASGSTPSAAQARSKKESAGRAVTSTRPSARSRSTLRSATSGDPGTA